MMREKTLGRIDFKSLGFNVVLVIVLIILLSPILILFITSFLDKDHLSWPFDDFTYKWYIEVFKRPLWVRAFINSLIVASLTTVMTLVLCTPAAYVMSKRRSRIVDITRAFIASPIMIPPVMIGISLLIFLSRIGLRSSYFAIAFGHTLWAGPIVFITMTAVFERLNPIYAQVAQDLGANSFQAFWKVTLPMVKSGLVASIFLAFVLSTQEFIIALFLYVPKTIILPVEIYTAIRYELSPAISAISVYLVAIVIVGLIVIDRTIGIENIGFSGKG
jgi:putative spermidine/putrescine transport system permease protein/spermidine/putrescine transport system permease protein